MADHDTAQRITIYVNALDSLRRKGDAEACDLLADYAVLARYGHDDPKWAARAADLIKQRRAAR